MLRDKYFEESLGMRLYVNRFHLLSSTRMTKLYLPCWFEFPYN